MGIKIMSSEISRKTGQCYKIGITWGCVGNKRERERERRSGSTGGKKEEMKSVCPWVSQLLPKRERIGRPARKKYRRIDKKK